jgi:hypothetical protein
MKRLSWTKYSKCLDLDTNLFFEKYEEDLGIRSAIDHLCTVCPVQRECLANAVSRQEWGVWGGVYFEKGKMSKEFNSHKKQNEWFSVWQALTMDDK